MSNQATDKQQVVEMSTTKSPPIYIPDSFKGYPISSFNLQHVPACDLESVLIPGGLVRDRIERLGFDISSDLANEDFTFLCVLKGGFQFFNQLLEVVRQYHRFNVDQVTSKANSKARRIQAEFIRLISYEDDSSRGEVRIIGLESLSSLRNKNVLVCEDIIDSGLTMTKLLAALSKEKPKLIRVASLFFKRTPKNTSNYYPDYVGFSIPDSFIVGCNLDYNNYFRDLQHVCVISNEGKQRYKASNEDSNGSN
uniref:Hypoxanthine phosphoribosyltransferase n=1 Tax=Aceria tosichella TaxID=561515 RepID=A0A6G1SAX9_9ACAR